MIWHTGQEPLRKIKNQTMVSHEETRKSKNGRVSQKVMRKDKIKTHINLLFFQAAGE